MEEDEGTGLGVTNLGYIDDVAKVVNELWPLNALLPRSWGSGWGHGAGRAAEPHQPSWEPAKNLHSERFLKWNTPLIEFHNPPVSSIPPLADPL